MSLNLRSSLGYFLEYPGRTLRHCIETLRCCHRVAPFYSRKYPFVVLRGLRLLSRGFHADESLALGLFDVNLPDSELHKFISKHEMVKIQEALNPEAWRVLLNNKSIFYAHCQALGLPVPQLYAIFINGHGGNSSDGALLRERAQWEIFFKDRLPAEFVIKPAYGAYGRGVMVFRRFEQDEFVDAATGKVCRVADMWDIMLSSSLQHGPLLIQKRLKSHPELVHLSGSESLQTVRVYTYVDKRGTCKILHAFFKPIVGSNVVDNHRHGMTGNLAAEVNVENGTLKAVVKMTPNMPGLTTFLAHPDTGHSFEGFSIPLWDGVCKLAKEAASKFLPLRLIGWDIGVTPSGPYIIEGNWAGDPPSWDRNMDEMLAPIREDRL